MNEFINLNHIDIDVTVSEIEYIYQKKRPKGFTYSKLSRDYYTIAFVLSGSVEYCFSDRKCIAKTGDIIFLDKNSSYSAKVISKENWEHFVISFKTTSDNSSIELPIGTINKTSHNNRFEELFREVYSVWSQCGAAYKMHTKSIVTKILYEMTLESISNFFCSDTIHLTLKKVATYIEENYQNKITIEDLAKLSGYSTAHFSRIFNKVYGTSPIQYLNHIRITHAKNLIKAKQHTMTHIAQKCGFSNVYYFSTYFKKITGVSPKEY